MTLGKFRTAATNPKLFFCLHAQILKSCLMLCRHGPPAATFAKDVVNLLVILSISPE